MLIRVGLLLCVLLVSACAIKAPRRAADESFELRLMPVSLGHELALQQQLSFSFGKESRTVDALLEVNSDSVQLVVQTLGQSALRLSWDGHRLDQKRAPWLPPSLRGERVLSDLQLTYWPVEAIRAALPTGWQLIEEGNERQLRQGDQLVETVRFTAPDHIEIVQHRENFRMSIVSVPVMEATP